MDKKDLIHLFKDSQEFKPSSHNIFYQLWLDNYLRSYRTEHWFGGLYCIDSITIKIEVFHFTKEDWGL